MAECRKYDIVKSLWQKLQIVCSILCITVYAASALYASILIYRAAHQHDELTYQEYFELKDIAVTAGVLGWTHPSFKDDIFEAVSISRTLQAVIISGPDDYAVTIEKIPGTIKWNGKNPHFDKGLHILKKLQSTPLRLDGQPNLTISAVATYIDFNSLLFILRKALLAILAAVVLSFTMLMINILSQKTPDRKKAYKTNKSSSKSQTEAPKPTYFYPDDYDEDDEAAEDEEEAPFSKRANQVITEEAAQKETDEADNIIEDSFFDDNFSTKDDELSPELSWNEPEQILMPETHLESEYDPDDEIVEEDAEPERGSENQNEYEADIFGLFDEEPSFADELAPELEKAEEADQELSLITAVWMEEGVPASILTETAATMFKPGSLIALNPPQGVYIVLPETTLDEALVLAKQFHHKVCAAQPTGTRSELLIGLSARVGRSLHALRLINETERALGKAGEDPKTPIVAFRADPEKYKAFLARTQPEEAAS